jgi:cytochrome c
MDMAHPCALSSDSHFGLGSRCTAPKLPSHCCPLLVSALWRWTLRYELRGGHFLCLWDGSSLQCARRTADFLGSPMVSGVRIDDAVLGPHASRRSGTWGTDHVGSNRSRLHLDWSGALWKMDRGSWESSAPFLSASSARHGERRPTLKPLLAIVGSVIVIFCAGCSPDTAPHQAASSPGAPELMIRYGCPTCHVIPGVPGAAGKVGPSLKDLSQRSYLAGTLQNSPDNLVLWIQHPQRNHPGTAMPEMDVTAEDAREIAIFLEARE